MTIRTCVYFDPAVPACRTLVPITLMTGCSVMAKLRATAPWLTTRTPVIFTSNSYSAWSRVQVYFVYNGGWRVRLWHRRQAGDPAYITDWYLSDAFFNGKFHSVAVTHNDGTGKPAAFLDGSALTRAPGWTWNPVINGSTNQTLWLFTVGQGGSPGYQSSAMHNAMAGDIKVWNRDLTAVQLLAEAPWGSVADPSALVCYYNFAEQTGQNAYSPGQTLDLNRTDRWCLYDDEVEYFITGTIVQRVALSGTFRYVPASYPEEVYINIFGVPEQNAFTVSRIPDVCRPGSPMEYNWCRIRYEEDADAPPVIYRDRPTLMLRDLRAGRFRYRIIARNTDTNETLTQDYILLIHPNAAGPA
jgi:hypothetical protein